MITASRRAAVGYAVAGASIALYAAAAFGDEGTEASAIILLGAAITSFGVVGALLLARVPDNVIGLLLLSAAGAMAVGAAAGTYATTNGPVEGATATVVIAALLNQVLFFVPIVVVLIGVPLVFPDGRYLSPRWRWIAILTVVAMFALSAYNLAGVPELDIAGIANPLFAPDLAPVLDALNLFSSLTSVIGFGGAALSIVLRYRRGTGTERQQVKWLAAVVAIAAVAFPTAILLSGTALGDAFFAVGFIALIALPGAIAIAVLRYRLYEIDRIVSRTLGWGVVTGLLLAVFAVGMIGLQTLLQDVTQGDTFAVAASTLVALALIDPVRTRVQGTIDRRFNRTRYDAERTVATFAGRLRAEVVLATLVDDLRATTDDTVQPAATAVWLRARSMEPR